MGRKRLNSPNSVVRARDWGPAYCAALSEYGHYGEAAKAAGVNVMTAVRRRKADPEFARAEAEAIEIATNTWEAEAYRRAVKGCKRPIYQGGKKVGHEVVYSDTLLLRALESKLPAWRPKQQIEVTAGAHMTRDERKKALAEAKLLRDKPLA